MTDPSGRASSAPRFHFDLTDPLSYAVELELGSLARSGPGRYDLAAVERVPITSRGVLADTADPAWARRLKSAREAVPALPLASDFTETPPLLVPDPGKAHELVLFASRHDQAARATAALFHAFFAEGRDIGRIDVLVEIGRRLGLSEGEVKVTLDLDIHAAELATRSTRARERGIELPCLTLGEPDDPEFRVFRGYHGALEIADFLFHGG